MSTYCRYCAKDFEPSVRHGRGAEQIYCSMPCKQRNNMDKQNEKRKKRYQELVDAGANSYQATYGSTSTIKYAHVLIELKGTV